MEQSVSKAPSIAGDSSMVLKVIDNFVYFI